MTSSNENRGLSVSSIVAATKNQVSTDLGAETILLSMQSAEYYGLDAVGSRIWELARAPIRVSDICDAIAREYDVDPEQCEADVLAFLQLLVTKGLIEVEGDH
jgi:Coenzyme PQQ synthesis protein D (PqqD)